MPRNVSTLSDRELGDLILELTVEIEALRDYVEADSGAKKRTWRLFRSTILMAGGFIGATLEIWSLLLSGLGIIDWIDTVADDAQAMNRQLHLRKRLADLEIKLALATVELNGRLEHRRDETT